MDPLRPVGGRLFAGRNAFRDAAVFLVFLLLTAAMTWPWAARIRDACPDPGDPYLNSYILAWDFHQTFADPLHLFDSTLFFPTGTPSPTARTSGALRFPSSRPSLSARGR